MSNVRSHVKQRRTPQDKKVLSYSKDRVENYAESRSTARLAIRKHKKLANSVHRKNQEVALQNALKQATAPLEQAQAAVSAVSREQGNSKWRKVKAAPLLRYRENLASGEWSAKGRGPASGSAVATDRNLHSPAAHRARLRLKAKGR